MRVKSQPLGAGPAQVWTARSAHAHEHAHHQVQTVGAVVVRPVLHALGCGLAEGHVEAGQQQEVREVQQELEEVLAGRGSAL